MAEEITMNALIGFNNIFPNEEVYSKEHYGNIVGKKIVQEIICDFLSFYRTNIPTNREFFSEWFKPFSEGYYQMIIRTYETLIREHGDMFSLFSVESMLRLFVWSLTAKIPEKTDSHVNLDTQVNMLKLYLLFNNDVLTDYQKPTDYRDGKGKGRPLADYILAMDFSQSDLINIDYAQLVHCQFYKVIYLLDFLESDQKYWPLLGTFLQTFRCTSKQAFVKAIGAAVTPCFRNDKHGWTILEIPDDNNANQNIAFFEQLVIHDETVLAHDDYSQLRNRPFQRISERQFRVIFDLFLVKKVYNGSYFKLKELTQLNNSLFKQDFAGLFKSEFSEGVLLYHILDKIFVNEQYIKITGNTFKAAGVQTEPDFYVRGGNDILLFESKDVFIKGTVKLSYDFPLIEDELKKRLYKEELENGKTKNGAVLQIIKNIKRAIDNEFKLDVLPDKSQIYIYPIIILHDSIFSAPGLNFLVNSWFNAELQTLINDEHYSDFDFSRIHPVSIIEIDTLIFLAESLKLNFGHFEKLIRDFHSHVRLNFNGPFKSTIEVEQYARTCSLPFAEFARNSFNGERIKPAIDLMLEMFKAYGVPEK